MPKPHLVTYRERITVDGRPLGRDRFAALIATVLSSVDAIQTDAGAPTEFEVLTAAGFLALADAAVDAMVGKSKAPGSKVAGHANTLVFPSLESANIGYNFAGRKFA